MTSEELKDALLGKYPVFAKGIMYKQVNAVIYRVQEGRIAVTAELLDQCGHSVTICPIKDITKEKQNERRED